MPPTLPWGATARPQQCRDMSLLEMPPSHYIPSISMSPRGGDGGQVRDTAFLGSRSTIRSRRRGAGRTEEGAAREEYF